MLWRDCRGIVPGPQIVPPGFAAQATMERPGLLALVLDGPTSTIIPEPILHLTLPFVITSLAILSAAGGVWLTSMDVWSRRLVPFSGGLLMGVAVFWVLPE